MVISFRLFFGLLYFGLLGGVDGLVKIWDVYWNWEVLRSYKGYNKVVMDLDFVRVGGVVGRRFLSGGFDRKVRLWDMEMG